MKRIVLLSLLPLSLSGCIAPFVIGSTAVVGTAAMEERGVDGATTDSAIRMRINYEWSQSPLNYTGIEICVYNGRVLLTGPVRNKRVQDEAVRLAKLAAGVREVIDATKIKGQDNYFDDGWITTKLKSNMIAHKDIVAQNYTLKTYDGIVYILGTAQDADEVDAVIETAEDIKGVKRVVNLIEIKRVPPREYAPHKNITYNDEGKKSEPENEFESESYLDSGSE